MLGSNDDFLKNSREHGDVFCHLKLNLLSIRKSHPVGLSALTECGSCGQLESMSDALDSKRHKSTRRKRLNRSRSFCSESPLGAFQRHRFLLLKWWDSFEIYSCALGDHVLQLRHKIYASCVHFNSSWSYMQWFSL